MSENMKTLQFKLRSAVAKRALAKRKLVQLLKLWDEAAGEFNRLDDKVRRLRELSNL